MITDGSYIHTPAQSRAIAELHETAIYPIIWPDGSPRGAEDIRHDHAPWIVVTTQGSYVHVSVRNISPAGCVEVDINQHGQLLEFDVDTESHVPCTVVWRADPRWPSALWTLCVERGESPAAPCPMCGTYFTLEQVVANKVECPAHQEPGETLTAPMVRDTKTPTLVACGPHLTGYMYDTMRPIPGTPRHS